ncbi:hypothetical protein [Rubinisphaera sp.]|uniref:hypothetical protein n=1 Tax=Rubinisphaera sp. TaxID=2024857 RepID=UPI000C12101D|nr:hypothetical protein [Rubinisphaera sp.]MBV09502.1 hypothetical protein [Rubinisphaera sp.]HCS50354.1 hypothetical protein [Planctomycetaceae bacterium]|tara:strand:- start:236 stop:604 length:369 start_codon:yes stop_codon:yes gene_type:complete
MTTLKQFGNIVSQVRPDFNPNRLPSNTTCNNSDSYLQECRDRLSRGWDVNHPISFEQHQAAYLEGLIDTKPHDGEQVAEVFNSLRPEPFDDEWKSRLITTFEADPRFCRLFSAVVRKGVKGG